MPGDLSLRAPSGNGGRKLDKRKERKSKRKQSKQKPSESGSSSSQLIEAAAPMPRVEPESHTNRLEQPMASTAYPRAISPRKKTLLRHKASTDSSSEPSFVSEVKEIKKNRKPAPKGLLKPPKGLLKPPNADAVDGKYSLMLAGQSMDGKTALFSYALSKIVLYQEHMHESPMRASPGTLLAHGEFEIFQLHGGDVTYLACGKTFVYPLLPKLKMLRTSSSEFVLPLVNPQRYWKIHIDTSDSAILLDLETTLKRVVQYTNLACGNETYEDLAGNSALEPHAGHVTTTLPPSSARPGNYTPFFSDIPESPPSVLVSPLLVALGTNALISSAPELVLPRWEALADPQVTPEPPLPALTSAMASFGVLRSAQPQALVHPRFHALQNPHLVETPANMLANGGHNHKIMSTATKPHGTHSDTSSMDSLLDEYEETISVTKSVKKSGQYSVSRPVSRSASHVSAAPRSTARSPNLRYLRLKVQLHYDFDKDILHSSRRFGAGSQDNGFPTASLSRYERNRQNSISGRSKQSSVSELYSSTSNWMEPGQVPATEKLASSKSTYSLSGNINLHQKGNKNLNETYREIYRSISQRHTATGNSHHAPKAEIVIPSPQHPTSYKSLETPYADPPRRHRSQSFAVGGGRSGNIANVRTPRKDGLSSVEVYKLLSERDNYKQQSPPATGLQKLFGW